MIVSPTKAVVIRENLLRPRQKELQGKIMSRHRFEGATQKEDIVGRNRKLMLRPGKTAEWTCKVSTREFDVATKM